MGAVHAFLQPWWDADRGDRYTLGISFLLCTSLIFMGFDGGVLSLMFGSESWINEYGMNAEGEGNFSISVWPPTIFAGLILAPICGRLMARRPFFVISSLILLLGAVLMTIGTCIGMLYTGRVIAGIGTGLIANCFNSYVVEVNRPQLRGFAMSFNQLAYNFGVFLSFWIGLGTNKLKNGRMTWRSASALQCLWGLLVIIFAITVPESPRQLLYLSKQPTNPDDPRVRQALKAFMRLRQLPESNEGMMQDFRDLCEAEEYQRLHKLRIPYSQLFRYRGFWKRFFIGGFSISTGQLSGISALLVFGIVIFNSLGFSGSEQSYFLNGLGGSLQLIAGIFPLLYIDRLGRRTILLFGILCAEVGLLLLTALLNRWPDASNHTAAVFCVIGVYLVYIGYSGGTGAAGTVVAIEIWDTSIRQFGFGIAQLWQGAVIIAIQKGFPPAIAKIGPKMYYVFLGMNTLVLLIIFFFWPETKGLSLESMNRLFGEIDVLAAVHAEQAEHEHEERETSSHYKYDAEKQGPQAKHVERV